MRFFSDLDHFDLALLVSEGCFLLTVVIIVVFNISRNDLKTRSYMMSKLMIAQAIESGVVVGIAALRVVPERIGIITYWSLRQSNNQCTLENMVRHNIGLPLFLLFSGIATNLLAHASWRRETKNKGSLISFAILWCIAGVGLAFLSLYPDYLCKDPFGGDFFQICIICSQSAAVLLILIQAYILLSHLCESKNKKGRKKQTSIFSESISTFLTMHSGISTLVQDDGSRVATKVLEEERERRKDARRTLKFVLENNFLTSAIVMIFELIMGIRVRKVALRTRDLVLSRTKRMLIWFLVHYDNFVEISWRIVHLSFISVGSLSLLRNFIHKDRYFDANSYDDWSNLSINNQEESNLCWLSTYLEGPESNSEITYNQNIWNRTQETKLDYLDGETFVPNHNCITVRTPVYLWLSLAGFVLCILSTICFRLIHIMNRWSSKFESDSSHACARFLRLGLVVPALIMIPFVVYVLTLEIQDGTRVENVWNVIIVTRHLHSSIEPRVTIQGACLAVQLDQRISTHSSKDVTFIGSDYFLGLAIILGASFIQMLGTVMYLYCKRYRESVDVKNEFTKFFGIELSRFSKQKSEFPTDDQGVSNSAVDEFEAQDHEARVMIREIAAKAKSLSLDSHILKEAAGEQFLRSFLDLLEAEHDYGDVLHAMVTKLLPLIHEHSKDSSPIKKRSPSISKSPSSKK